MVRNLFSIAVSLLFVANGTYAEELKAYQRLPTYVLERAVDNLIYGQKLKEIRSVDNRTAVYRDVSVSDIEVTQLKKDFEESYKREIDTNLISIGPVTVGCECELAACTNQVFLSYQYQSILFSKVNGKWQVSRLHKWWEEYRQLYNDLAKSNKDGYEIEIQNKINALVASAPECGK